MPVSGVTSQEIEVRADFFAKATEVLLHGPAFKGCAVDAHPRINLVMAEAFFVIADAYERHHLKPGKRIEPIKQAAIACATVCVVAPLRPRDMKIEQEELLYINPMLAMRASASIIDHPFHNRSFDEQRRHYRMIGATKLPSLRPLIDEANAKDGVLVSGFSVDLDVDERHRLNGLINYFTVLHGMKIMKDGSAA